MQIDPLNWNSSNAINIGNVSDMEVECFFDNLEQSKLLEPRQRSRDKTGRKAVAKAGVQGNRGIGELEQRWNSWLFQRDRLRTQIKRGEECLEQVRRELASTRADLEEWPDYEQICGKNPLNDYFQSIAAKEQIAKFLPTWLKRQQTQLQGLNRKISQFARQKGREQP